ncbi:DUF47 family protein [Mucilaginibacter sp. RS28]|uniref:DUF47 family protein n=1 Tax=Mucilaginibacter straminoryzae TaxID=2932774 RepID=A0A9X2B9C4_9SPHI|nr:DUF47 family protein [Mucilaginibacter straminoryzae]MCJ8210464.1 DUF47 family protein [Mucilaginibacter straminoryzae]
MKNSLFGIMPGNNAVFYRLFDQGADTTYEMASLLYQVVKSDAVASETININNISRLKEKSSSIKNQIYAIAGKALISPFGRDDMYGFITSLDSVADYIDVSARRLNMYRVEIKEPIRELSGIIMDMCSTISECVKHLHSLTNLEAINECCIKIKHLEHKADAVYRKAMATLVEEEQDPLEIIKYSDIYSVLEKVTDKGERVAEAVESIVVKNA